VEATHASPLRTPGPRAGPGVRRKILEGPATAPLFVLTRTHTLRLVLAASVLWPSQTYGQAKDAFVEGLTQLINAVDGTFGDEGPALHAAVEAMGRGLAEWDARIARVEAGFRADVAKANPPAAARMRATLGTVYLERGRVDDALSQFTIAAELDPSLSQVHLLRGLAHERTNRTADAAAAYRAAWQARPDEPAAAYLTLRVDPTASAALAALATAVGRRAESASTLPEGFPVADLLDDASVKAPLFAPAAYAGAFTLIRQGRYDEALVALNDAVGADPLVTDDGLRRDEAKRASAAMRVADWRVAGFSLQEAQKRSPQSAQLRRLHARVLASLREHEASEAELREAVRLDPRDERSRIALADVQIVSGHANAALETLRATIDALPESGESYWQLGRIAQALGDAEAVRWFERAATKPVVAGLARLYAIIGQAHHAQFDLDGAATAYRRRVQIAPNDRDAHVDLAEVYRAQDKLDEARVECLAAALIDPASAKTFSVLGQIDAAAGRDEQAVAMLRRAVTLDGGLLEARYALSRALLRLGRTVEAEQELRSFEQAQARAMEQQRRQFLDNQQKIDEALKTK
jgi:tetratricopeptide (TPR) repeat protein